MIRRNVWTLACGLAILGFGCFDNFRPYDYRISTKLLGVWSVQNEFVLFVDTLDTTGTRVGRLKYIIFCTNDSVFSFYVSNELYVSPIPIRYRQTEIDQKQKSIIEFNENQLYNREVLYSVVPSDELLYINGKTIYIEYVNRDLDKTPNIGEARIILADSFTLDLKLVDTEKEISVACEFN